MVLYRNIMKILGTLMNAAIISVRERIQIWFIKWNIVISVSKNKSTCAEVADI